MKLAGGSEVQMQSYGTVLRCRMCRAEYAPVKERVLCACGQPLEQEYDLAGVASLGKSSIERTRTRGIWRYAPLLPVRVPGDAASLGEGGTPMFLLRHTSRDLGIDLFLKDEGQNPTGTFKARGGSVGVARLRELGWRSLAMPTVGSGGSAWAAYAAQLSVRMKVGLPTEPNLPVVGLEEPRLYGAEVDQLPFPRETAFSKMKETLPPDTLYVGGFSEPYRLEGEKTILYEIAEDLGWRLPDFVFWPTGGGVGLVGLAKAASELGELGWVQSSSDMTVVSAQHESGAPIAAALHRGHGGAIPSAGHADGLAPGATHGAPFAGDYILARVRSTVRADGVVGSDDAIRETMKAVAARDGALLCPEGALAVAGAIQMTRGGDIPKGATVVCVNTATGHRYPRVIAQLSSGLIG